MKRIFYVIFFLGGAGIISLQCTDRTATEVKLQQDTVESAVAEDTSIDAQAFIRQEVFKHLSLTRTQFENFLDMNKRATFQFYQAEPNIYTLIGWKGKINDDDPYDKPFILDIVTASTKLPLNRQNLILGDQKLIKSDIKLLKENSWVTLLFEPKLELNTLLSTRTKKYYNVSYTITALDANNRKIATLSVNTNPSPPASVSTRRRL